MVCGEEVKSRVQKAIMELERKEQKAEETEVYRRTWDIEDITRKVESGTRRIGEYSGVDNTHFVTACSSLTFSSFVKILAMQEKISSQLC